MLSHILPFYHLKHSGNQITKIFLNQMSLLKLIIYPDPFLTKPCKLVDSFDKELLQNVDDMFESMRFYRGIGLAANQVGIDKKIFVMDLTESKSKSMNEKQYCRSSPIAIRNRANTAVGVKGSFV